MVGIRKGVIVLGIAAAFGATAFAAPAASAAPAWASNYWTGKNPDTSGCTNDARTIYSRQLGDGNGHVSSATIQLRYSPYCKAAWAKLVNGWPADPGSHVGCKVVVRREDGRAYSAVVDPGDTSAYTLMVDDDQTHNTLYASRAEGSCDSGNYVYTNSTPYY